MDNSFTHVAVQVPRLSGFDKSHQNLLTSKCGVITPILVDELIPGSKIHLRVALSAQLPPLAADTFMRCQIKCEAFYIPWRLLAGSFESWFTDQAVSFQTSYGAQSVFQDKVGFLPTIGNFGAAVGPDGTTPLFQVVQETGSLMDYLGFRSGQARLASSLFTAGPLLAYHRAYDDWYRNTLVQRPVFVRPMMVNNSSSPSSNAPSSFSICAGTSPYYFFSEFVNSSTTGASTKQNFQFNDLNSLKLADGKYLYELRQRNFGLDYFTTATPTPQLGNAMVVGFGVDQNGAGDSSHFSIAALRAANSLQQFSERNQLSGVRYQDQLRARYGANLSSGVAQRSLFLGGATFDVYTKGIYQQGQDIATTSGSPGDPNTGSLRTNNPFQATTGAKFGSAAAAGAGLNINFEANEPGYLLVNATLVPKVTYATGIHRRWRHYVGAGSLTDLANPILQNVGPQPIDESELTGENIGSVFGYTDRYAEFKTMEDELHGLVRDGESLEAFALQRSFASGSTPMINSAFLQIPTNYMDQVTAVTADLSNYGYWMDCFFDYKVAQPLAKYSLPSLQDPAYEHGRTVVMQKGGQKI